MTIILKSTKTNRNLLRYHRSVVKQSMATVLQEGDHDIIGNESKLRTIAVDIEGDLVDDKGELE